MVKSQSSIIVGAGMFKKWIPNIDPTGGTMDKKSYTFRTDQETWDIILEAVAEKRKEDFNYSVNRFLNDASKVFASVILKKKKK